MRYFMESNFIVKCKQCGYEGDLKDFETNTCDYCGEIKCPKCGNKEEI
jgi:hypothetical protein